MITIEYFVGIYGFIQLSMMDVKLLDNHGQLLKKKTKLLPSERDGIAIYEWVADRLKHIDAPKLRQLGSVTDGRVKKLLNNHSKVNNFLLGLLLLRAYLDEHAPKNEQLMMLPKVSRLIEVVDGAVSDDEFDVEIKKTTWRTADNIYRQAIGKAQLSDEVRDAKFKRILR